MAVSQERPSAGVRGYRDESENTPQYLRHLRRLEAVADENPIQIKATYAKSSWIKFFVLGLLNTSMGGTTASAEDGVSHWPSVVVINRLGQEKRLEKFESNEEAEARAERVQADLDILGLEGWCKKYDVPLAFARA